MCLPILWFEEAVQGCRGRDGGIIVIDTIEAVDRIDGHERVACRIVLIVNFVRQPSFRIIDGGRYVQESEVVRRVDRDRMLHAVLPVFDEVLSEKLVFFRMDRISEITGIGDGDFFVPAFLTYNMFAFEGINTAHRDAHIGQGDAQ